MTDQLSRRQALGIVGTGALAGAIPAVAHSRTLSQSGSFRELLSALEAMPALDVHSHAFPELTPVTERMFLAELALSAWMLDAWFPHTDDGGTRRLWGRTLFDEWKGASAAERARLNESHGIEARLDEVCHHMRETVFVKQLVKEMAAFFDCKPALADVIACRNDYANGNFWGYVNDLFRDVKLEGMLVQGSIGTWTTPANTVADFDARVDADVHNVASAWGSDLLLEDVPFEDIVDRYMTRLRKEVDESRAVAIKSGVAKGPGADVQPHTFAEAEAAWESHRKLPVETKTRVMESTLRLDSARIVEHYLLWKTCDFAYERDLPLHIHIGNGEGQDRLSTHYPYKLENVIRYPVELPQKPVRIVLIHGGWPHVGEAAYLCHVFPNVWFDMSLMNPIANRGLHERMLTVLETAPLSKIMMGSDAYHLPEFFYLAAKWGRRYTASSLAVLVDEDVLTLDEATRAGGMILRDNAMQLHKL